MQGTRIAHLPLSYIDSITGLPGGGLPVSFTSSVAGSFLLPVSFSGAAAFILAQAGHDAQVLDGGLVGTEIDAVVEYAERVRER